MPIVEQSRIRLEYPAGDEQSIRSEGAIKLRARVIPPHVNNRVWFVYRIDEGQWIRRQATREIASTGEDQYFLAVDVSTGRVGDQISGVRSLQRDHRAKKRGLNVAG